MLSVTCVARQRSGTSAETRYHSWAGKFPRSNHLSLRYRRLHSAGRFHETDRGQLLTVKTRT